MTAFWQVGTEVAAWLLKHHHMIDWATAAVTGFSILHTILPPWDWNPEFVSIGLREFPRAQKLFYATFNNRWYRVTVYLVGYVALNARSTVWRYISVNNASGPNANKPTMTVQTVTSETVTIPTGEKKD